jgi:predicted ester cyclase
MSSVRDALEQGVGFYNAGDMDGLANSYTDDAVVVTPTGTFEGRAAIREQSSREKAAFPDRTLTIDLIVEQGDTIAAEVTWTGTHTGALVRPDGTEVPPTGKRVEMRGMSLVQARGGKAAMHHQYWDNMAFGRQLGLVP